MKTVELIARDIKSLASIIEDHKAALIDEKHTIVKLRVNRESLIEETFEFEGVRNFTLISEGSKSIFTKIEIKNSDNLSMHGLNITGRNDRLREKNLKRQEKLEIEKQELQPVENSIFSTDYDEIYARLDVHCSNNIHIDRVLIWGYFPCNPTITEDSIGIRSTCSNGLKITNCTVTEVRDGISIHDSSNVEISNSRIWRVGRDGISTLRVNGIKIAHNIIVDFCPNYTGIEASSVPSNYDHADCIQLTNTSNIDIKNNEIGVSSWLDESNSSWTQSIFIHEERNVLSPRCKSNCQSYTPYNINHAGQINITNNSINNRHLHGITVEGHCNDVVYLNHNYLYYAGVYPNPNVVSIPAINIDPPC